MKKQRDRINRKRNKVGYTLAANRKAAGKAGPMESKKYSRKSKHKKPVEENSE